MTAKFTIPQAGKLQASATETINQPQTFGSAAYSENHADESTQAPKKRGAAALETVLRYFHTYFRE